MGDQALDNVALNGVRTLFVSLGLLGYVHTVSDQTLGVLRRGEARTSLTFLTLVLAGQSAGLVLRARDHVWRSRPAIGWVAAIATAAALASIFAWMGWFMAGLPGWLILALYGASLGFGLTLDLVKVLMLRFVPIDRR